MLVVVPTDDAATMQRFKCDSCNLVQLDYGAVMCVRQRSLHALAYSAAAPPLARSAARLPSFYALGTLLH